MRFGEQSLKKLCTVQYLYSELPEQNCSIMFYFLKGCSQSNTSDCLPWRQHQLTCTDKRTRSVSTIHFQDPASAHCFGKMITAINNPAKLEVNTEKYGFYGLKICGGSQSLIWTRPKVMSKNLYMIEFIHFIVAEQTFMTNGPTHSCVFGN